MKLQFDANQSYQLDAISAVVDLFDGQPQGAPLFSVIRMGAYGELFGGQERTENGIGNQLLLDQDRLCANTRTVETRIDIEVEDPEAELDSWELFDAPANTSRHCPHFSVEMTASDV